MVFRPEQLRHVLGLARDTPETAALVQRLQATVAQAQFCWTVPERILLKPNYRRRCRGHLAFRPTSRQIPYLAL